MRKPVVYLAGKMTGLTYKQMKEWRTYAARQLRANGFEVIDPCDRITTENLKQLEEYAACNKPINCETAEIVGTNLYHVARSDIVLAEFDYPGVSIGTIGEIIVAAREMKIPVVAWGENHAVLSHSWVDAHLTAYRLTLDAAIAFIIESFRGAE